MTYYGAADLAAAFRTVRDNTIAIAEEIPEDRYAFRPTPELRSTGELLSHIAVNPRWAQAVHTERLTFIDFERLRRRQAEAAAEEQAIRSKAEVLDALRQGGERFTAFLASLTDVVLAERVGFPEPVRPASRTRFEMLLAVKEHEMHHRAQLMTIQRLLGLVPHLTRRRQAMLASATSRT
jgi:uncharacterized damage-inducible protein DinB